MDDLYKLMAKKNIHGLEDAAKFCDSKDTFEILETSFEALAITSTVQTSTAKGSLFNFSASISLSGADYPCTSPPCRIGKVHELAKFAAAYSDSTTIHNPFDFAYFVMQDKSDEIPEHYIRREAFNAFVIALEFKPLIERERIKLSKTIYLVCSSCKKKRDKILNNIENNFNSLAEQYLFPLIQQQINIKYGRNSFHLAGIEEFIGDDMYMHYQEFPEYLLKNGKKIKSMRELSYQNPLIQRLVNQVIDSLMFQKVGYVETLTKTYLTNNTFEKILLEKYGKPADNKSLTFFAKGLPVIQNMSYENILKIRELYPDEFTAFQTHVSELISKANTFESQEEFDEFVRRQLDKELGDLKKIQKSANKKFKTNSLTEGFLMGATIAISLATNNTLPLAVEFVRACYSCQKIITDKTKVDEEVEQSPTYFYYRLAEKIN